VKIINYILSFREIPYPIIRSWVIGVVVCLSFLYTQTLGDLNQDGLININDILREVNIIMEIPPLPSDSEQISADLNVDDNIDISDIIIIVDIILGNLESYCTQDQWDIPCENNYSECCYPITSHEFEWEINIFGEGANYFSQLDGAVILNENDIWVAGRVHWPDTTFFLYYNALHFDGEEWEELEIIASTQTIAPLYSFFAFNESNLWLGGARPIHFNGENWIRYDEEFGYPAQLGHISHIWGTGFDNMYFFNSTADVVHWDGEQFTLMETSTGSGDGWIVNPYFIDIWGIDENNIFAFSRRTLGFPVQEYPQVIQHFNGNVWTDYYRFNEYGVTEGEVHPWLCNIWGFGDTLYIMSLPNYDLDLPGGLWKESIQTGEGYYHTHDSVFVDNNIGYLAYGLKGNHPNDILSVGWQGVYAHYNGEDWQLNTEVANFFGMGGIYCKGIAFKDDTVVLYGQLTTSIDNPVFIARGTRIE